MTNTLEEQIRARAHSIWEEEGRPEGRSEEHWHRARQEVAFEGAVPKTAKPRKAAPRKTAAARAPKTAAAPAAAPAEAASEPAPAKPKRAPRAKAAGTATRRSAKAKTEAADKTV
ncbi:MAG: DUF2934 domain-containing protein [Rhodobacteraceae bacterium]|nr:DUF2934 domain-containing protein [Paracoccaceae bacterium]